MTPSSVFSLIYHLSSGGCVASTLLETISNISDPLTRLRFIELHPKSEVVDLIGLVVDSSAPLPVVPCQHPSVASGSLAIPWPRHIVGFVELSPRNHDAGRKLDSQHQQGCDGFFLDCNRISELHCFSPFFKNCYRFPGLRLATTLAWLPAKTLYRFQGVYSPIQRPAF